MKCLNCDAELVQTPGKRARQFCDSSCRSGYWQKQKTAEKKKKIVDKEPPAGSLVQFVKPAPESFDGPKIDRLVIDEAGVFPAEKVSENLALTRDQIMTKIKELKAETKPTYITTPLGEKVWKNDIQKKIDELRKMLL